MRTLMDVLVFESLSSTSSLNQKQWRTSSGKFVHCHIDRFVTLSAGHEGEHDSDATEPRESAQHASASDTDVVPTHGTEYTRF
jgi:hypothetical protein